MKLSTIWTIPAMAFSERLRRSRDSIACSIAARLPQRIKYWVTILEIGKATMTSPNVPATPLSDILNNLETPKSLS